MSPRSERGGGAKRYACVLPHRARKWAIVGGGSARGHVIRLRRIRHRHLHRVLSKSGLYKAESDNSPRASGRAFRPPCSTFYSHPPEMPPPECNQGSCIGCRSGWEQGRSPPCDQHIGQGGRVTFGRQTTETGCWAGGIVGGRGGRCAFGTPAGAARDQGKEGSATPATFLPCLLTSTAEGPGLGKRLHRAACAHQVSFRHTWCRPHNTPRPKLGGARHLRPKFLPRRGDDPSPCAGEASALHPPQRGPAPCATSVPQGPHLCATNATCAAPDRNDDTKGGTLV